MKGGPAIGAGGGRTFIAVTSYDEDSGQSQILVFCSADQGRTWTGFRSPARQHRTDLPAAPVCGRCQRRAIRTGTSRWLGNYQSLAAAADVFHPVWTDTRDGDTQIYTAAVRA